VFIIDPYSDASHAFRLPSHARGTNMALLDKRSYCILYLCRVLPGQSVTTTVSTVREPRWRRVLAILISLFLSDHLRSSTIFDQMKRSFAEFPWTNWCRAAVSILVGTRVVETDRSNHSRSLPGLRRRSILSLKRFKSGIRTSNRDVLHMFNNRQVAHKPLALPSCSRTVHKNSRRVAPKSHQ
jgi:hypothetical protein